MSRVTMLLAAASPCDRPTHAGREILAIEEAHARARARPRIEILSATSIDRLRRAMLRVSPQRVQLMAHGTPAGLVLEDADGHGETFGHAQVVALFAAHRASLEWVVLSTCHGAELAAELAAAGVTAIGFHDRVTEAATLEFSRGLHDALAHGRTLEFAVEEGTRAAAIHGHTAIVALHRPR